MDIHHLPPQQLSSDSTLSGWTLYPEQVFTFAYAGGSYLAPHHVNSEQQHQPEVLAEQIQYRQRPDAYYVPTQTETPQHSDLPPADSAISYWPTAQVPATDPVSSTTSMEPSDHFPSQWYYGNHDLSSTEPFHHAAPVDQIQSMPHGNPSESYREAGYPDVSPLPAITAPSPATTIPAFAPLPTIAPHQSGSGHDLIPQDATVHSALCEGAATFQTTDASYAQMGPYDNASSGEAHPQYAPALAEEQQQPYEAAYAPAAQDQYVAPAPPAPKTPPAPVQALSPTPPIRMKRKASPQSMDVRSRGRSPMGHLPYEDIAKARKSRRSSVFSGFSSSPSSTPRPRSPILQTLTFITYPDLEPRGHGRGECDGNGDDDDDGSPRRGRRGRKQPKKEPFLACYFCRGRKIACHPKNDGGDKTCTQCAKRRLECKYPHTSRRGQRKPQELTGTDAASAAATTTASKPRAARGLPKRSASSHVKI